MTTDAHDNVHDVDFIAPSGNPLIDAILFGFKYAAEDDGSYQVTYSVPGEGAVFNDTYLVHGKDISEGFFPVPDDIADLFRGAADFISTVSGLQMTEVSEDGDFFGHIRLAGTTDLDPPLGAGVFGDADKFDRNQTGDVFIDDRAFTDNFIGLARLPVHEIAHAVGLAHPGEGFGGAFTFDDAYYGDEYTMLDTNFATVFFDDAAYTDIYPTTLMYVDVLALQHLYGVNETATAGDDNYIFDLSEDHYMTLFDIGGHDTLQITGTRGSAEADSVTIDLSGDGDAFGGRFIDVGTTVSYFDSNNKLVGQRSETVYLAPASRIEVIITGDGNDVVVGDGEDNHFDTGDGNDVVSVGDGDDTVKAGDGNDVVSGEAGNDLIVGGDGADVIDGGPGDDVIWAGAGDTGDDIVSGAGGADTIGGGGGEDLLAGGLGNDVLFGGAGNDTLASENWTDGEAEGTETNSNQLWGGDGEDKVFGAEGDDQLGGGAGDDTVEGRGGDDTLYAGASGEDTMSGGNGDDVIFGGTDSDTVLGGAGADELYGGSGNDDVQGGDGDDTLYGGAGADTLAGGAGDDTLRGGAGSDLFVFEADSGDDVVDGFELASDTLDLSGTDSGFTSTSDVTSAAVNTSVGGVSGVLITLGGGDSIFLTGFGSGDLVNMEFVF